MTYTSPNATGSIGFTPVANANGTATVTVTVDDGQSANNTVVQTFLVTVNAVNDAPTLNALSPLALNEDPGPQTVALGGIAAGGGETQTLTVSASSSNTGLIPTPTVTYTSPNATGSIGFTPVANANGTATVTVTVDDGQASSNTVVQTFLVAVNVVNDQPTLNALSPLTIDEDAGLQTVGLGGIGAGGAETQTLTVTASSSNTGLIPNPTVTYTSPAATGSIGFTPVANANGTATVTVTVNDGQASNNTIVQTFLVTVNAVNDTPTLNALSPLTINEDPGPQTVNLAGISAGGGESQTLVVSSSSSNTGLIPNPTVTYTSPAATGSIGFTPVANTSGTATVTVTVNDGQASNNTIVQTFLVTVNAVNDQPTLNALSPLTINEDATAQTVNLAGISAGGGESQTLVVSSSSSNTGLIPNPTVTYTSPNATGSIGFTPVANTSGTATITVTVNDGQAANNTVVQTFLVTVNAVNDQPTLNALSPLTIDEDAGLQTVALGGIAAGGSETQTLTVTASSANTGLIPTPTVTYTSPNATGSIGFTPVANANGTATVTVTVNDGQAANNTVVQTFLVTVNAVNDQPTLNALSPLALNEDPGPQTVNLAGITAGGGETQTLTVTASSSNTGLIPSPTVTYTSPNATGSLSFTPVANANGTATVTVTVDDGQASNDTVVQTFLVAVNVVNDQPTLNALSPLTINEDATAQTVNLAGISAGGAETQTLTVTASSSNTGLIPNPTVTYTSPNATGSIGFTPVANTNGTATVTVMVDDGQAANNTIVQTFLVTVNAVNDVPTLNALSPLTINEDAGLQTVALGGIAAGGGESQTLTVTASSSNAGLIPNPAVTYTSPNATGSIDFTPVANTSGTATVTVTVNDGQASNNTIVQTFLVTVNTVNDQPTLNALSPLTINEDATAQTVNLAGISAGGGESQTLVVSSSSSNTGLIPNPTVTYTSPNATGSIGFTPVANASGTATITVTVNDGQAANNTVVQTFLVTVNAVNDVPTLNALSPLTIDEDPGLQTVALGGIAAGGAETQTLTVTATSSNAGLIPTPTVTYTSPSCDREHRLYAGCQRQRHRDGHGDSERWAGREQHGRSDVPGDGERGERSADAECALAAGAQRGSGSADGGLARHQPRAAARRRP